jgi:hypothetical protein
MASVGSASLTWRISGFAVVASPTATDQGFALLPKNLEKAVVCLPWSNPTLKTAEQGLIKLRATCLSRTTDRKAQSHAFFR